MIDLLAAVLRGEPSAIATLGLVPAEQAMDAALKHGVLPLVAERLAAEGQPACALGELFRRQARIHAAADLVREDALRQIVVALRIASVPALVVKGAHLAYAVYPRPDLRPRLDSDFLVRPRDRPPAVAALLDAGYVAVPQAEGSLVSYQSSFSLRRDGAVVHIVDLHWRLANPQAFGDVLTFDDLDRAGEALPALANARVPSPLHAMLLAAIHQVAHHPDDDHLIWSCDLDRLARRLDDAAWRRVVSEAEDRRVGAVLARGLDHAASRLGTPVPDWVVSAPALRSVAARSTPTAAFLEPGRRHVQTVAQDLRLLPTWSARSRLIWQHLFPAPSYMRTVYAPTSRSPLPVLYVRRAWRGAWRWMMRP